MNLLNSNFIFRYQLIVNSTFFYISNMSPAPLVKLPDSDDVKELIPVDVYESKLNPCQYFGIFQGLLIL